MEQSYENDFITIYLDGETMNRMDALDMTIYHTPGSSTVYMAENAQFQDDNGIVSAMDCAEALGYDYNEFADDDVVRITFNTINGEVVIG